MRNLSLFIAVAVVLLSCSDLYYTGDKSNDDIIKSVDNKLKTAEKVYRVNRKRLYGKDTIVYYTIDRANNKLLTIGLSEIKANRRTLYILLNGELTKVTYIPNLRKGMSNIYFYENEQLVYKRNRVADSTDAKKFIEDIVFFKKDLQVK